MKTIFNKLRFALILGFVALSVTTWSQVVNNEKFSASTQIFLDELTNGAKANTPLLQPSLPGLNTDSFSPTELIAKPDTINGKVYISAFVTITDESAISQLKNFGVEIQCQFDHGLMTTLIPIDKIDKVADIVGVKRVKVATRMRLLTDKARENTNVDDVLTLSNDAQAAGLPTAYDGTGVILGIIDTGIDFQHIAFKDKNGNSRIKRAYVYNGSTAQEYTNITNSSPTTDDNSEDHGTHTSSTAGGSSVIINGENVTVTDDHASATYGGMAPGADLYLAGIYNLNDTYLTEAFQKMYTYANQQNKPLVVSNSWGSQWGPHDGTGEFADICNQYFGGNNTNKICLFAASNDAGNSKDGEGGGYHISGTATEALPLQTIVRSASYSNTDGGYFYQGLIASAWARNTNVTKLGVKIHVLDAATGAIKKSWTVTNTTTALSGLDDYYTGSLGVYYDQVASDKTQIILYSKNGIESTGTTTTTQNGSNYYKSKYTLAVEFYPISGANSALLDVWGGNSGYFTNHLTTNGYNWQAGSDDMSVSDEATIPDAISIGAHVTKNRITDYTGSTYNYAYTMNDIAGFSSYATSDQSPTGLQYPWITAPGARLVAGVNHYHTSDYYNYINGQYGKTDRVNANTTYPYGAMQGTSMACPTAAGIVALWLQVAQEEGITMTINDIKEIMRETAIHDYYTTTGPNASHFGNGKINALAGIEYILGGSTPTITAIPTEVTFDGEPGNSYTSTVSVRGRKLTGDIIATLNDNSGVYSITPGNLGNGGELVITFVPNEEGEFSATITLTSPGAEPVTITINGIALIHTSTLTSNVIEVPVYQSEAEVDYSTYIFSEGEVLGDVNMSLAYPSGAAPGEVKVLAKNDEHILNYELHHKVGNGNWTYPNGNAVATANHVGNSYVVNDNTFTFPQDATEMWITMNDSQLNTAMTTYYIPVTVAKSIVENGSQDNTYGAPVVVSTSDGIDLEVSISGYKSASKDKYGHYTGIWKEPYGADSINYCVYMPQVHVVCQQLGALRPYMYRAWLLANDDITYYNFAHHPQTGFYGTTPITDLPKLLAESCIEDVSNPTHVLLPEELGDTYEGMNTFGAPVNILDATDNPNNPGIVIAVRVYYQSADEENGHMLRGNRDGGYGFGEGRGSGNGIPTGVNELFGFGKQVVDVQYVNALGMQSREPFDGLNIVVTRYSDGSITTTKVVK